jgi:hypothetical protein
MQPAAALYSFFMGDAKGVADQMVKIGAEPKRGKKEFRALLERIFNVHGVKRNTWFMMMRKRFHVRDNAKYAKTFTQIVQSAYAERGYRFSPRYAQFGRSLIPIMGILTSLSSGMPFTRIRIVTAKEAILALKDTEGGSIPAASERELLSHKPPISSAPDPHPPTSSRCDRSPEARRSSSMSRSCALAGVRIRSG